MSFMHANPGRSWRPALLVASVSLAATSTVAFADTDHPVRYLHLQNNGDYVISDVELKWITPDGDKKSNKFTKDIAKDKGFCLDLEKYGDVPDGSEVWLKAYIALGDTESCRKDNPRIYTQGLAAKAAESTQLYKMGGHTLTNNMCKLSSGNEGNWSTNEAGNSDDCPKQ
ncbi:MAG: hypothetical protein AAF331_08365 [Pseudomonadota bacterium]